MKTTTFGIIICLWGLLYCKLFAQIPVDAQHFYPKINYFITPVNYNYGIAWVQAATLQNKHEKNDGYILIDYIKLIEEDVTTKVRTTLTTEGYDVNGTLTTLEGGFYNRFPNWYCDSSGNCNPEPTPLTNAFISGGILRVNVGDEPDSISHFWGKRQYCSPGKRHIVEIRALVSGNVSLQIGMDYTSHPTHIEDCKHVEAFFSNWIGDTNGVYETITYPTNYDFDAKFDRSDYGVTVDGKFFLSKRVVDFLGADTVILKSDITNWKQQGMKLNDQYYEFESYAKLNPNHQYIYCFNLKPDGVQYIPDLILDKLVFRSDAISNGYGGYNFSTKPVVTMNTYNPENPSDLQLIWSNDRSHIIALSQHTINRLNINDMSGRKVAEFQKTIPNKIPMTPYISGVYIITIETDKGKFTRKIIY
jgi:hypothetical protein